MSVSIVIPAFNESASLEALYRRVVEVVNSLNVEHEIILCDDASLDDTKDIIKRCVEGSKNTRAIYHKENQGLFKTFDELYNAAVKDYVILFPGDGQWDPGLLSEALKCVPQYDIVIAARQHKQYPWGRKINSWLFNSLVRVLFGCDLYDIGSVKLVRREIFKKVTVKTQSAFTEAERMIKARALGYRIGVIWVKHKMRVQGQGRGATPDKILKAFRDMVLFRLSWKGK